MAKDPSSTAAPKKPGRIAQLRTVLQQSKALDPKIVWWMAGAFVLTLAVIVGIGWLVNWPVYAAILGLPLAALAATIVMSRRAEGAAYAKLEGQPGAAGAALTSLRGGWFTSSEPVAVEGARSGSMADAALVYRAVGRPGVVLVAEGPEARAQRLLLAEKKRTERVAPGVPVTVYRVGSGKEEGVVEIRKLTSKVQRMRATLSKDDVLKVNQRLRALGGVKLPVPQGIDPARARPDRKGMRGR
ncbi:MAG TPA: DUF4191 domain-containing protein [Dermatophilaceae bacterium]|jgi:hypothetical protein|uniref:DUF4191 domain-containing protein n=1 Tax=Candidatus Phosphoribacter hodrii TaxID=2953743 RepID=A0A934X4S2_9MICO|nr:DUF4191 domain-containing protein [Candidatus Phosphoribacter hodrii]OPZ49887.1 MAG: hypothetical protein BWY91_02954 [bacterium ADurb.BinA028]HNV15165.1 DUF4191 domain-containing protein [Dermatophilaceae bacterium]HOA01486.1 DUF4191 domain-containing protein [Dermatophilaceae bacterium]HOA56806.1 DUF4191 domain-containing protein [Dermatophilaceae bacterium]